MRSLRVKRRSLSKVLRSLVMPIVVLTAACSPPIPGSIVDVVSEPDQTDYPRRTKWTVIAYIAADNELEPYAEYELTRLGNVVLDPEIAVVLLIDRGESSGERPSTRLYATFSDEDGTNPPVRIGSPCLGVPEDADVKLNTGDGATLASFVSCAKKAYPAEQYLLYLWGYGMRPHASAARTVGYSDTFGLGLDARTVRRALAHEPVSVVAFDGPRTALIEVAYELRRTAPVLLAAQNSVAANGWPLAALLTAMSDTAMSIDDVASAAVHAREGAAHHSLSIIRTDGIERIHDALNEISSEAYAVISTNAVRSSVRTSLFQHPDAMYSRPGELDLDLAAVGRVMTDCGIVAGERVTELTAALGAAVSHGPVEQTPRLSGLSVHLIGVDEFGYAAPHDAAYFADESPDDTESFFATSAWVPRYPSGPGLLYRLWYEALP